MLRELEEGQQQDPSRAFTAYMAELAARTEEAS